MMKKGLRELFSAECLLPNILILLSPGDSVLYSGSEVKELHLTSYVMRVILLFVWIFDDAFQFILIHFYMFKPFPLYF